MKWREAHAFGIAILLFLVFLTNSLGNGQITRSKRVPSTGLVNVHSSALYVVSKDGIYTVLSGSSGEITRSTDAIIIVNQAIALANTISGSVLIMNGDYSLSDNVEMKSNIMVYVQLDVTFIVTYTPTAAEGVLDFRGVTNAHFITETEPADEGSYPRIIGKGTSNDEFGILMTSLSGIRTTYCSVGKIAFSNIGGDGICLRYADRNELNGTYVRGFARTSGSNHQGLTIRAGSYNKLINCHINAEKGQYANHPLYLGGEGPVTYNEIRGGIYENSSSTHATYWCAEPDGGIIDHNVCVGTVFRGCRSGGYSTALKLNAATNSRIGIEGDGTINPVILVDCQIGLMMGDGNRNAGGNHGNVIYAIVRNCRKGSEWLTQFNNNVENNTVYLDVDVDTANYPATGEVGYTAFDFGGFWATVDPAYVQYNTIHLQARNCQYGVVFAGWDAPQTETQEARYNTFYLDANAVSRYAIYWFSDCGGYGRFNTFNGTWRSSLSGNCGSIPNADYVYTDVGTAVVATNTFNPA